MQAEGVRRQGSVQAEGVCKQCVQAGECERRSDGDASRVSVLAEVMCRQWECAGGVTHRQTRVHMGIRMG